MIYKMFSCQDTWSSISNLWNLSSVKIMNTTFYSILLYIEVVYTYDQAEVLLNCICDKVNSKISRSIFSHFMVIVFMLESTQLDWDVWQLSWYLTLWSDRILTLDDVGTSDLKVIKRRYEALFMGILINLLRFYEFLDV